MTDVKEELELMIRSRYPIIYLITWEEMRLKRFIQSLATSLNKQLYTWSASSGMESNGRTVEENKTAEASLDFIEKSSDNAVFILKDFHPFLKEEMVVIIRRLRDLSVRLKRSYKTIIIISPILTIPPELEKEISVLDFPLPTLQEVADLLKTMIRSVEASRKVAINATPDVMERAVKAALGLTENEAENVFAKALVSSASFDERDIPLIISEKKQIIRKTGLLEYFDLGETIKNVGGLENLKKWLNERAYAFSERAREYGLPQPKGLLLLGVQGCGKSLVSKAVASLWQLPLLRLDVGQMFNSYIGASEANMRKAIKIAESIAPVVLWLDEVEKGFGGVTGSGNSDAGTTARVFATFLTWLQEKTSPVFVVATANNIDNLPPELVRKGRFDDIFFVDLPSAVERKEIFLIHLRKRGRAPERFDIESLAAATEGFSGAEIEQAVIDALYRAFPQNRDILTSDIEAVIKDTVPLSKTMSEDISRLRTWAKDRARPASA
jgi:SpoVK/Ycf46/Vps4 family AAA+-type ATPase